MPRIYEKIKSSLDIPKIVHIIGTNGKGTTGRFLAQALHSIGFSCGHYTSPHILKFNERVWVNGKESSDELLENSHLSLQELLPKADLDSLSYFEYTTILAMIAFAGCEYIIMEAGLGGEFDATAVFPKCLTLVTPIALDHESFLGSTVERIATTKLNAIQNSAILAFQSESDVYEVAYKMRAEKSINIYKVDELLYEEDRKKIALISKELSLAAYLTENLSLSISALNFFKIDYEVTNFKNAKLFGRLSKVNKNIIVDVGHNTLAAKSIVDSLSPDKYIIIYNSFKDKNYKDILQILKPISLHVEIIEIDDERVESIEVIKSTLISLKIEYTVFKEIKPNYNYLVFGSFCVVEAFLREYNG
ncbi:bifunctional folylpolyglutamate synthase/dihydrofolate synthase [Candidatus Sulfurimonas marisnigri]|uniref:Bifunctional folylpolyglutamate synthase/dihydrofolate synthase n=2 Tax=Candidatus Sulfurimonas marisnigri TaxID=2740405 RepID=A0A7S7M2R5_9BACT|nr:bifunctional folylpolyglutamate synthase/dihydrofolate synthase [Candidatus Sulfurimonas marisnigri]